MLWTMKSWIVALAATAVVSAQAGPPDGLPRLTRLADGVYAYEHADPTKPGVTVNNLIVVTSQGVLVADGQGTVENTAQLVAAVATLTPQPIKFVVVGSVHGDHRGGDTGFPKDVRFVKDQWSATWDGREIQVLMLGRSHTGTDLEVWLPKEGIIYMSEVFSNRVFPSMANSYPTEWVAALTRAAALDARVYVPAHAAIDAAKNWHVDWTRDNLQTYRTAIEKVISEGKKLHDEKVPVADAAGHASWGPFSDWIRRSENAAGALKRVYLELDGAL
jgi:cyclase